MKRYRIETYRGVPTTRRWLLVGRALDSRGRIRGLSFCWVIGMWAFWIERRKPLPAPLPAAPTFHHETRTVMTKDGPMEVRVPVLDAPDWWHDPTFGERGNGLPDNAPLRPHPDTASGKLEP